MPRTIYVDQDGFKLTEILLPLPPEPGIKGMGHYCPIAYLTQLFILVWLLLLALLSN